MAEGSSLVNSNAYYKYKKHEADAFKIIFRDTSYKTWRLEWILHNAKQTVPSLDKKQLNAVIDHLKQASELRKKHSLRYQHAPLQERTGHDYWSQLIKKITDVANSKAAEDQVGKLQATTTEATVISAVSTDLQATTTEATEAAEERIRELQATTISFNEVNFLRFVEDIESCIAQAGALWQRVAAGELPLSTASIRL
jgi:hypothetical protein